MPRGQQAATAPEQAAEATREAYRDALVKIMKSDELVYCLDSDTGLFTGVDFGCASGRYLNLGIAEQNLMGVAAGLDARGKYPFVNTMAAFASTRALEAVKIDIAYNRLPVRIVATHAGLSAGHLGPTHHGLEDLACLRTLPHMTVVVPVDAAQTRAVIRQSRLVKGPLYVRLGRKATPPVAPAQSVAIGTVQWLRQGDDAVALACGPHPVMAALTAHEALRERGIGLAVANVHTIKPLDRAAIVAAARGRVVVTVEDHWITGGLGGAVAELLSEACPTWVRRIGVPDTFASAAGPHEWLLEHYGITGDGVTQTVLAVLAEQRGVHAEAR
ncbi:MAG: transketolase family protein [Egibacteraceae bacterium]